MNGKIIYTIDSSNLIAYDDTRLASAPIVKRKVVPQVVYPSDAYDDYGIGNLYSFPSFNFSIILIIIGIVLVVAQFIFFVGGICIFMTAKKSVKCSKCGGENYRINGEFPDLCVYCKHPLKK